MKCGACSAVLSGETSCPTCGTAFTISREGVSIPALIGEMESRLERAIDGRYELRGLLGHGGMGAVFLAVELNLDRLVAIKVLPPTLAGDDEVLGRFQREAKTAARLDHPAIVPIYSVEEREGLHYFVMKFVPGVDLQDELSGGAMEVERARELLWECAVALGHAHRRGVIHRDVKPANVMIDPGGRAVLTDFGIAKAARLGTQMTSTGQMLGTPQYMSPEQMDGVEVDGRADQYSLGMVGYHMLTGRSPFGEASLAALVVKQMSEDPEPISSVRSDVPKEMIDAIERAIRKKPDERFSTMEDFAAVLWPQRAGAMEGGGGASPSGAQRTRGASAKQTGWRTAVAAAVVLVVAVGTAWGALAMRGGNVGAPEAGQAAVEGVQPGSGATVSDPTALAGGEDGEVASEPPGSPANRQTAGGGGSTAGAEDTSGGRATVSPGPAAPGPTTGPQVQTPPAQPVAQPPAAPRPGALSVTADPFAMLWIDGIEIRQTPVFDHELAPGTYEIRLTRAGYQTFVDTVEILSGNPTRLRPVLIPN